MTTNVIRLLPTPSSEPLPEITEDILALTLAGGCALKMLSSLLPEAARDVEHASRDLTVRFKTLAESAGGQSEMVQALLATIGTIEMGDKRVPLDEFIALFSKTLDDAVSKLLSVSKKALAMVYSMDDAIKNLHEIENFSKKIQALTKQSNLLALNATIEAQRAGEMGRAFSVVAGEVKTLSKEVAALSEDMRARTGVIMKSVTDGFTVLKEVATTDMNSNIAAKDTLELLMSGLVKQSAESMQVMQQSAQSSREISQTIHGMIVNLQFQDRNSQITENTVDVLNQCAAMLEALRRKTGAGDDAAQLPAVQKTVDAILSVIKLGDIRHRYAELPQKSGIAAGSALQTASGDAVELF